MRLSRIVGLLGVLAVVSPMPDAMAVNPGSDGLIAYVRAEGETSDIYVVDPEAGDPVLLPGTNELEYDPAWSPDGERLAFVSRERVRDDGDIYVMNADGSDVVQLTSGAADETDPTWSPNGRRIAFLSRRRGVTNVGLLKTADPEERSRLRLHVKGTFHDLSWSPNGGSLAIAVARQDIRKGGVHTIRVRSGREQRRTDGNVGVVDWSPGGRFVGYRADCCSDSGDPQFRYVRVDGSRSRDARIPTGGEGRWIRFGLGWSPSGGAVAYSIVTYTWDQPPEIRVIDADGSNERVVVAAPAEDAGGHVKFTDVSWQPVES